MLDKTILTLEDLVKDECRAAFVRGDAIYNSDVEGLAYILRHLVNINEENDRINDEWNFAWSRTNGGESLEREDLKKMRIAIMRTAHECISAAAALDKLKHSIDFWEEQERGEHEI